MPTAEHDLVGDAAGLESGQGEIPHLDGVIDQLVVAGCTVEAEIMSACRADMSAGLLHRCGELPGPEFRALRAQDLDQAFALLPAFGQQEDTRAIEESMRLVQMCRADGKVPRIDLVAHQQCCTGGDPTGTPAVLVQFFEANRTAFRLGADTDDVAGELTNHVAARNPGRQGENLPLRRRIGKLAADRKQMGFRAGRLDAIANRCSHEFCARSDVRDGKTDSSPHSSHRRRP